MSETQVNFANEVGAELSALLMTRARERLGDDENWDQYTAVLSASLLVVAEILRESIDQGADADAVVDFAATWLKDLLDPTE